ncbi:MAG: hypothetical protein ARM1_0412 [Candidatus Micrarchaeota archaeon]|nr:MAG: hypothetical protein ARM1_0412 [Candidatus Micrarchaeota archaeon]
MRHELSYYISIISASSTLIAAAIFYKPYFILASLILITILITLYRSYDLLIEILIKRAKVIRVIDDMQILSSRDIIVRYSKVGYICTAIAELYTPNREIDYRELESAIKDLRSSIKISCIIKRIDLSRLIEDLKTRKALYEIQLTRLVSERASPAKIAAVQSKIDTISKEISRIDSINTFGLYYYISATCISDSLSEAKRTAMDDLKMISERLATIAQSGYRLLNGSNLERFLYIDYLGDSY